MSDKVTTPASTPTTNIILDDPQVRILLMSMIDKQVTASVRERNKRFRNRLIGVLTVVVLILSAIGVITLQHMVDNAVASAVEKATEDIRFDSEVASLNIKVLNLDFSDGFTPEEAQSIIEDVKSLTSKEDEQDLRKLEFAIDTAIKNFAAIDRLEFVFGLESITPDSLLNSGAVIQTMIHALGLTLLADAGAPDSWTDDTTDSRNKYNRYRAYADKANISGYPELYLLYEMLLGYIEKGQAPVIDDLIEDTGNLNDEDAENFVQVMTVFAGGVVPGYISNRDRVTSLVAEFLCAYGEQSEILRRVSEQAELNCQIQAP